MKLQQGKSDYLFERAKKVIPGGVNSPVRAFKSVGIAPKFIKQGYGCKIIDEDDNEYIDYVCSWGPLILGHANEEVLKEILIASMKGTSFGTPTEKEIKLAEIICEAVPSVDMVRLTNSGTEAVMSAVRLARAFTGRNKIIKFEGCYHGHSDGLLVKAGSGAMTTGVPDSAGVPQDYAANTITASYNCTEQVEKIFKIHGDEIAAVIVEPVAGNMGVVVPGIDFLKYLRKAADNYGSLLIFDEVITGFRVAYGGAQSYFNIMPDITVLGKIIGGGLPVGAFGGKKEIMRLVSPEGPVYQAGTLSGNPVAVAAGIKTLEILRDNHDIYDILDRKGALIEEAFKSASNEYQIPVKVNRIGSMLTVFFTDIDVVDYRTAMKSDRQAFSKYFCLMLEQGVYVAPSQYEAIFVSAAHGEEEIEKTTKAINNTFRKMKG